MKENMNNEYELARKEISAGNRIEERGLRQAVLNWQKLDVQTKAIYVQTAAPFIPQFNTGNRKNDHEKHIGLVIAYAMKMAYTASCLPNQTAVSYY